MGLAMPAIVQLGQVFAFLGRTHSLRSVDIRTHTSLHQFARVACVSGGGHWRT